MLRKTLLSLAVGGALLTSGASALELGELTFQSPPGEPLAGTIVLSDAQGLTAGEVAIRLGSESEFRQAGFAPTRVLSQLRFSVLNDNGQLKVSVRSTQTVNVDELRFVLAASWPSGQVVREYQVPLAKSVLVDKTQPDSIQSAKPKATPTPSVPAPAVPAPVKSTNTVFEKEAAQAESMASGKSLDVRRGNTLWSIASGNRVNNQLTIYQTMMAIQAINQDAFYANNINLLKEGAVLRLPTKEQIALFNKLASKAEFDRQHQAWMALKSSGQLEKEIAQQQLNTQAAPNTKPAPEAPQEDKLQLASGQNVLPVEEAGSNPADVERIGELETELSATQELLDKESREKADLGDKLSELNKQLATLEKLISLKDQQMAELQRQFMSAQQALQEQKNTVDQLLEADQLRREQEAAEEDSIANKVLGNPIVVSVAGAVLLLLGFLVGLLMHRSGKKKAQANNEEFDLASAAATTGAAAAAVAVSDVVPEEPEQSVTTTIDEPEEELIEEDPFAFDFDGADGDAFNEFDELDESVASVDAVVAPEPEQEVEDELDEFAVPETDFEEEEFDALDAQMDELAEPEMDVDDLLDEFEVAEEEPVEDIPTMEEVAFDGGFEEESIDELAEEVPGLDVAMDEQSEEMSEEESFVNNLLNDMDEGLELEEEVEPASLEEAIEESLDQGDDFGDIEVPDFGVEEANDEAVDDDEEEIDFFDASGDEVATKLDLARAYMDMGDEEGARVILEDVINVGNETQIAEANSMMERMFPSE